MEASDMITWTRSANINHGQRGGAIEWAIKASNYVNDKFGTNLGVHANVAGPTNQIHWFGTFDSLAAFEEAANKIVADEGYQRLVADSSEANFFDTHSFTDALYQSIG
jgi:hypothetical protein